MSCSQVPSPVDIPTPNKEKRKTAQDHDFPPVDVLADKQKKRKPQGNSFLPADVHAKKKRSAEESVALEEVHVRKKKKRAAAEQNVVLIDVHPTKEESADDHNILLLPEGHTHKEKKKKKKKREDNTVLSAPDMQTQKKSKSQDNNILPADEPARKHKKKKKKKIEDNTVLSAADMQTQKKSKSQDNNILPADEPARKHKKKKKKETGQEMDQNFLLPGNGSTHKQKKPKETFSADERKSNEEEDQDNSVLPEEVLTGKKKKKKQVQDDPFLPADLQDTEKEAQDDNLILTVPHKHKKKKRAEKETANVHAKKKKKKKRAEEEEDAIFPPAVRADKTAMTEAEEVAVETGKKTTTQTVPAESAVATDDDDDDDDVAVSMETITAHYEDELDPALVAELEEFIPNVKKRRLNEVQKLLRYDLPRFRLFKAQGLKVRWGRFTKEENQRIRDNIAHFMNLTGVSSLSQLLYPQCYGDLKNDIKTLKRKYRFTDVLADGIARSRKQILLRASKLDKCNYQGRFSEEEVRQLVKLQKLHGNHWRRIADEMGRSIFSLQKRFASIASGRGRWTSDEEERLKNAVKAHLEAVLQRGSADSQNHNGLLRLRQLCAALPWTEISHQVGTRHWIQCRLKWFSILKCQLSQKKQKKKPEGLKAKIRLIETLYALDVEDPLDVDWEKVAATVGEMTPVCTQKLFRSLKVSHVPNWSSRSYGEIIDFLQERVLPGLVERLQHCDQKKPEQNPTLDKEYALVDIFPAGGFAEVDNT
ncbi:transcription termination factor 1-like [Syngnathoides biaculeatus]|uniref:transcription termination factor 1-like n=1 Tax=Syngnathoides biaculeatus TaxID=300417 RepID=UPI002ADD8B98|nr:transcription termination factor 1-like [Syngnathoides biaculeatus]XP_061671952.1 transcription termination factor 1-like [Syngnathoides biaculeatus]